jgi:hypothetical protein
MKQKLVTSFVLIGLVFIGLSFVSKPESSCVNLYIDYGPLNNGTKLTTCVDALNKTNALDILKKANLEIEGTKKYGNGVICRVNGLPDETVEKCEDMPPAKAYWAIIVKEKKLIPFPKSEWGWGQVAVDQQYLNPGDSIGLVWANDGEVVFP